VRNSASIFDHTCLGAALISKRSNISVSENRVGCVNDGAMSSPNLVHFGLPALGVGIGKEPFGIVVVYLKILTFLGFDTTICKILRSFDWC